MDADVFVSSAVFVLGKVISPGIGQNSEASVGPFGDEVEVEPQRT
jgi:hypothetical protein